MQLYDRRGALTLPEEDYRILLEEAKGKQSVLEFGPGFSTYAFIEAGVPRILCCEYLDKWVELGRERFKDYPQVEIIRFEDTAPVAKADIKGKFDLAFVDSPKGYRYIKGMTPEGGRTPHPGQEDCSRLNTCLLALQHAPIVLLHDAYRPLERGTLGRLNAMGHKVTFYPGCGRSGMARIDNGQDAAGTH